MAKKLNEQNPLTLPKIRQHMLAHTSFLLAHTGQKGAPPAPLAPAAGVNAASEGGGGGGGGRKHGLEDADLGLFFASVRHFYAPAKCLFGVVETGGKGSSKFVYFFTQKN